MALTVATNTGALMAQAAASSVNKEMEVSMERLSSGKRINGAADDAAGVAIASRLTAEIRGTNQAIRNAMDGQALIDTAEGAHQEVEAILQRMREVAVQAANDTNDSNDRANLQLEIDALTAEINRISESTTWAGQKLLDGSDADGFSFQVGSGTASTDSISTIINSTSADALGVGAPSVSSLAIAHGGTINASDASRIDFTANTASTVTLGSDTFTLGFDVVTGTGNAAGVGGAAGAIELTTQSVTANTASTITINGVEISYNSGASDQAAAAAMVAAFNTAKALSANVLTLGHITATADTTDGSEHVDFTTTAADKASIMAQLMQADATTNASYTMDSSTTSGSLYVAAKVPAATVAVGTNTATGSGSAAISAGNGTLTITADASGSTSRYNTIGVTVEGVSVNFDTNADVIGKGYLQTSASAVAQALIQKLEDAGVSGVTMTESSGVITLAKGSASSVTSAASALATIERIDIALTTIGNQRASLGSVSNRLDSTVSNLTNISANLAAGRGRIEDADFAAETTSLAKSQILQQASTAMLAQANASKQNVLSLLQG